MYKLVLIFLFVQFATEHLSPLVRPAEDDALIDDQRTVNFKNCPHLFSLINKHVVVGEAKQHEFIHEVDYLCSWHEFLLERTDSQRKSGRVHKQRRSGRKPTDNVFNITLEVSLKQSIGLIKHKKLTMVQ